MPVPTPLYTRMKILTLVGLLAAGGLSVLAARRWHTYGLSAPARPAPDIKSNDSGAAAPPAQRVKVLSLKLTRGGFVPSSVTAPKGDYFLTVLNDTQLDGLELRLDREGGPRAREGQVSKAKLRWKELVDLHPGNYVVTEANHPDWVCRITISSSGE
jgi:hypothetical protein